MSFVGRDFELSVLNTCLAEALGSAGRLVWISGEAGIGKTRLAEELSRCAEGARVIWGRSWEGEGTPALWLWIQALRRLPRALTDRAIASSPELAALLGGPSVSTADPEQARFRLFDAVARMLREAGEEQPLVVVLDDLHAADRSTLLLLRFVARDLKGSRVLLIGTARESRDETVAMVAREALHVPLGRLSRDDVLRWIAERAPRLPGDAESLYATSEGNPLFVEELLTAAQKRGSLSSTATPSGIRGAIRAHLGLVGSAAREVLEQAAVFGRDAPAAALDPAALEEARSASIVSDGGEGFVRFSHVLLRDELYDGIAAARRAELHRTAARWYAREGSKLAAAHHFVLGGDRAEIAAAVAPAMREASTRLAFEDAAQLGERALDSLRDDPEQRCQLTMAIAEAWMLAGRLEAFRSTVTRAVELATELGRPELLARAALVYASEHRLGRDEPTVQLLQRALAGLGTEDSELRAEVLARLSLALIPGAPGEGDLSARHRSEAIAIARRLGSDRPLFTALRFALTSGAEDVAPAERVAMHEEIVVLASRLGETVRLVPLAGQHVSAYLDVGDRSGAARAFVSARERLASFPQPHYRWRLGLLDAMYLSLQGRFAESAERAREAFAIADEHALPDAMLHYAINRQGAAFTRGDAEPVAAIDDLIMRVMGPPGPPMFTSLQHALMGRVEAARSALAPVRMVDPAAVPYVAGLGWVAVWAGLTEYAELFYDLTQRSLRSVPFLFGPAAFICFGPTALLAGRLAAMLGRGREAEQHLRVARALAETIGSVPYVAHAELALGELLGDRAHAESALAIARELGMPAIAARAEKLTSAKSARTSAPIVTLERRGEAWSIGLGERTWTLRDTKGLVYLEALIHAPHREIHALELVGADAGGDAGPVLDARAKAEYRARADAVRDELEEATRNADRGRIERLRAELEALGDELARAVGLGGRDRRAASVAERARINVQRRLRDAVRKVSELDPNLGRHLELSVRTGVFCVYAPTWPA